MKFELWSKNDGFLLLGVLFLVIVTIFGVTLVEQHQVELSTARQAVTPSAMPVFAATAQPPCLPKWKRPDSLRQRSTVAIQLTCAGSRKLRRSNSQRNRRSLRSS